MTSTTTKFNPLRELLSYFLWGISGLLTILIIGNPANFQPVVLENVTTETTQITVEAKNKTFNEIGNPRVVRIEKNINGEWKTAGEYESFTEEYTRYSVFGTFKDTVTFKGMGMSETLSEGEYRVVVTFSLRNRQSTAKSETAYAYFTITAP